MKIIEARILKDGVNMSITYEVDGELCFLVISLEKIIFNFETVQVLRELLEAGDKV